MICFQKIAEQRIREAVERGDLDDLPGKGKPLVFEDDSHIPEDLRMAYKILKNAGMTPPEITLRKEISKVEGLLAGTTDTREKYRQIKKLNFLIMKLNMTRKIPINLSWTSITREKFWNAFVRNPRSLADLRQRGRGGGVKPEWPKPDGCKQKRPSSRSV